MGNPLKPRWVLGSVFSWAGSTENLMAHAHTIVIMRGPNGRVTRVTHLESGRHSGADFDDSMNAALLLFTWMRDHDAPHGVIAGVMAEAFGYTVLIEGSAMLLHHHFDRKQEISEAVARLFQAPTHSPEAA